MEEFSPLTLKNKSGTRTDQIIHKENYCDINIHNGLKTTNCTVIFVSEKNMIFIGLKMTVADGYLDTVTECKGRFNSLF